MAKSTKESKCLQNFAANGDKSAYDSCMEGCSSSKGIASKPEDDTRKDIKMGTTSITKDAPSDDIKHKAISIRTRSKSS